jgi:polysaccharide export outer membrane protein
MFKKILFIIIFISTLISCTNYRKITYLQNLGKNKADTLFKYSETKYKIQPADILYVGVSSIDADAARPFNNNISTNMGAEVAANPYLIGYTVDVTGFVELPVIGKIRANGLTLDEIKTEVYNQVSKFLKDAVVDVKLLSFKISVIGEVRSPGMHNIPNEKANIFEAIALAGDLTYYGNHRNVLILRQTEQGTKTIRIDLTDKQLLSSENFDVKPNDIIYIEPLKIIGFKLIASDYSFLITTLAATLTTILIIIKL